MERGVGAYRQQISDENRRLDREGKTREEVTVALQATVKSSRIDLEGELEIEVHTNTPVTKLYFPQVIPLKPGQVITVYIARGEKTYYPCMGIGQVPENNIDKPLVYIPRDTFFETERAFKIEVKRVETDTYEAK